MDKVENEIEVLKKKPHGKVKKSTVSNNANRVSLVKLIKGVEEIKDVLKVDYSLSIENLNLFRNKLQIVHLQL